MRETGLTPEEEALWECIREHAGEPFRTAKGLAFTYEIRGGEMFIDRREKSVTRATVIVAYRRAMALGDALRGPKMLNVFGASYIYPVFTALGLVPAPPAGASKKENTAKT
ncbi:MAG: hypothetical protein IJF67_02095 [Clostridia bacterium]|nr:hypothetical protein [Clostridia bacterium]